MYKIDSNIPIPPSAKGGRNKYPLADLAVGQSFFVPTTDSKRAKNLRSTFATKAKKIGVKVVSIADTDGVRVWRTM